MNAVVKIINVEINFIHPCSPFPVGVLSIPVTSPPPKASRFSKIAFHPQILENILVKN
jgi:hypothetical protein